MQVYDFGICVDLLCPSGGFPPKTEKLAADLAALGTTLHLPFSIAQNLASVKKVELKPEIAVICGGGLSESDLAFVDIQKKGGRHS